MSERVGPATSNFGGEATAVDVDRLGETSRVGLACALLLSLVISPVSTMDEGAAPVQAGVSL